MASAVYYRFKSQKDESKITFDGAGISVADLKKEISLVNNLRLTDFHLLVFDPSDKEYSDELQVIPRSSLVIVKRVPAKRVGKGKPGLSSSVPVLGQGIPTTDVLSDKARQQTVLSGIRSRLGLSAMSKRFNDRNEKEDGTKVHDMTFSNDPDTRDNEAAAMAAMFKAQTDVWEETQEKMSQAVPIYNSNLKSASRGGKASGSRPAYSQQDRPLPPSYVCYRCGTKGHWIHDCPTNNDRDYDNRPRIKRTTGIPRSFLKAVDSPSEGKPTQGVMVTPDGGYVVAQPDRVSWQKQVSRIKGLSVSDVRERAPADPALACPIDNKLFLDPVKTPCCGTLYCEECIHSHLLENDFVCPQCSKKINSLERLVIDKPMRTRVADYIDKTVKESNEAEEAASRAENNAKEMEDTAVDSDSQVHGDAQPNPNLDVEQLVNETIPQLQAQVAQLSTMLQNPTLPSQVRQSTLQQFHEYQLQLQQAHAFAALAADMNASEPQLASLMNQTAPQPQWFMSQQPAGNESAYQRLPVTNRRRNFKRERPSDFLEIGGGDTQSKMPRFWE